MRTALCAAEVRETGASEATGLSEAMPTLAVRVRGEYREMPGLRLTVRQAARLFGVPADVANVVLDDLRRASVLALSIDGAYSLIAEPSRWRKADASTSDAVERAGRMSTQVATATAVNGSLGDASVDLKEQLSRQIDSLDT
jgi:hypothetical protein